MLLFTLLRSLLVSRYISTIRKFIVLLYKYCGFKAKQSQYHNIFYFSDFFNVDICFSFIVIKIKSEILLPALAVRNKKRIVSEGNILGIWPVNNRYACIILPTYLTLILLHSCYSGVGCFEVRTLAYWGLVWINLICSLIEKNQIASSSGYRIRVKGCGLWGLQLQVKISSIHLSIILGGWGY